MFYASAKPSRVTKDEQPIRIMGITKGITSVIINGYGEQL